jgi:hypothetical protein
MPPSLKEKALAIARELGIPPDMPLAQMLHTAFELLGIPPPPSSFLDDPARRWAGGLLRAASHRPGMGCPGGGWGALLVS